MDVPDAVVGKLLLGVTTSLFLVFIFLINTYPFIDEGETGFYLTNMALEVDSIIKKIMRAIALT